jgi:hypothetical protein
MRLVIIKNGKVVNVIKVTEDTFESSKTYLESLGLQVVPDAVASPGDTWDGNQSIPPVVDQPVLVKTLTLAEFFDRFTDQEAKAILSAIKNQASAELWWEKVKMLPGIRKDDPKIVAGLNYMVSMGMLTQKRMDDILEW